MQQTGITRNQEFRDVCARCGFYSENNRYNNLFISNYLDVYVRDALLRVKGVGNVIIFGERKFATRIWLDPNKLASRGLTPSDVIPRCRNKTYK